MVKFFSAPIFLGIVLGLVFPYQSLSLIWLSSFLLFALLFVNTLAVDERKVFAALKSHGGEVLVTQFLTFLFFPALFTALGQLVLSDRDFVYGLTISALAPSALANPFFARQIGAQPALSLVNVFCSTLLCPILLVPILKLLGLSGIYIDAQAMILYLTLLTIAPIGVSLIARRILREKTAAIGPWLPALNAGILAALMFVLVGSSLNRLPIRLLFGQQTIWLFGFYLAMDFGIFILVRRLAGIFLPHENAETMALSVATRNFAASASLMLFFYPKAALPSALGLIVHCLFFQWLMIKSNDKRQSH